MAHIQKRTRGKTTAYVVRWTESDGTERSESFDKRGRYDVPGTAEHFKHHLNTSFAAGTYVNPDLAKTPLHLEVAKWIRRANTETTRYQRRNFSKNLGQLGAMSIGAIRPSDVRDWLDQLIQGRPWRHGKPLGSRSVRTQLDSLRTVLNVAVTDGILASNPADKVRLPKPPVTLSQTELPTVEQIRAVIDHTTDQLGCMMLLTAQTGMRPSEVAGLRVCDVDFPGRQIRVVQQAARFAGEPPTSRLKTPTSRRTVPLPAESCRRLSAYLATMDLDGEDLVFLKKSGKPWRVDNLSQRFRVAARRAGVPDRISWHDLRHFYASALIQMGASVKTVQVRMGHASPDMTLRVYTHLWPNQDTHTREAIDEVFTQATENPEGVSEPEGRVSDPRRDTDGTEAAA